MEIIKTEPPVSSPPTAADSATSVWRSRRPADGPPLPEFTTGLPRLVWEVMNARGYTSEDEIRKFLSPSLKDLRDPFSLTEMGKAVQRLLEVRKNQEHLVIYADYDLDGTSGLALLLQAFELMGFKHVDFYQPKRLTEGYGLHNAAIQKVFDAGARVLLSVDLGITAIEETAFAGALGMDVIITDHHLPKERLPNALAVVNPNRGNCTSGLGHLCGTGVAFYLVLALRRALLEEGILQTGFDPKLLLDCFTIGTITDMVPLIDENRVLVKHGLIELARTARPGLRVLMQALGLWGRPISGQDVAIRFAPKLNALSRMEMGIMPIDLYLVREESEAQRLVDRVLANNVTRQVSQRAAEDEAMAYLAAHPPKHSIFVYSENFHRGVVGLVATKLCQEFGLPAFVGSLTSHDGVIVGSARMPENRGLSALEAMDSATRHLDQFGGHAVAAGFELRRESATDFHRALDVFFEAKLTSVAPRSFCYDVEAELTEFDSNFMSWYEHMAPFGAQFQAPQFLLRKVKLSNVKILRGGHYRLTLSQPAKTGNAIASTKCVAIWFSPTKDHPLVREGLRESIWVDLLVEPQWNYFAGNRTIQLLVQDIQAFR